jgi:CRISPR-associated protein Cmr2
MSNHERFRRKLAALFHDPIDKPFVLLQGETSHEEHARQLARRLGLSLPPFQSVADHIAAAMERAFLPSDRSVPVRFLEQPEVRHPFSGRPLEGLAGRAPGSLEEITAVWDGVMDRLSLPSGEEEQAGRKDFFYLWRNLLPALKAESPPEWRGLWDVAPAETRIPDHSIFQHLTVTSAFSATEPVGEALHTNATLVLFSVGPVQSFLRQSRKTKDLYWSSYLLSHLCWTALTDVVSRYGPDAVLFPDLHGHPLMDHWMEAELGLEVIDSQAKHRQLPTLPNRFFAVVEERDRDALEETLDGLSSKVQEELAAIGRSILGSDHFEGVPEATPFTEHLRDAVSTRWAAVPLQPGDGGVQLSSLLSSAESYVDPRRLDATRQILDAARGEQTAYDPNVGQIYSVLYRMTEAVLGAQKTVRPFQQLGDGTGERGRKCSLCGERNVLYYSGIPSQIQHNEHAVSIEEHVDPVHLREGEGLCGMCFVKRFADLHEPFGTLRETGFPSTAEVAMSSVKARHGTGFKMAETKFKSIVGGHRYDAQLLFEENLRPEYLAEYIYPERDPDADQAFLTEKAEALKEAFSEHMEGFTGSQSSYYAVLSLDGDDMGQWLSGERAPDLRKIYHSDVKGRLPDEFAALIEDLGQRPLTPALHAAMSESLSTYALDWVRPIVEDEHHGQVVYAGGDDVLAFVSAHEVLDAVLELRAAFSGHLGAGGEVDFTDNPSGFVWRDGTISTTLGPEASASVGVAIAHYKTPLGLVLDAASAMEETAKERPGKDAVGIATLRRSGERSETCLPFTAPSLDLPEGTLAILKRLLEDLRDRDVSPAFIRTLRREMAPLMNRDGQYGDPGRLSGPDHTLIRSELTRLLRRTAEARNGWTAKMANQLSELYTVVHPDLDAFLSALDIADFLHKETAGLYAPLDHAS